MKVRRVFQSFFWGEGLVEETLNPETNPQTTTFGYKQYPSFLPTATSHPLREVIHPDGSWELYGYDNQGRKTHAYYGLAEEAPPGPSASLAFALAG